MHRRTAAHRKMTATAVQHNDLELLREKLFRLSVEGRALLGQDVSYVERLPRCFDGGRSSVLF